MPYSITRENQDRLLETALILTKSEAWHKDAIAFAVREQGESESACIGVFENFAGGSADLHFATVGQRLNKRIVEAYKFIAFHPRMFGLNRLFASIAASNLAAQRACLHVGFQFEYRKRSGAVGGEDAIIMLLTP